MTSGPAIQHAGDLAAVLSSLEEGEVLFLDEIHRMARPAEEMLYVAMEDFRVDVVVGKGPGRHRDPARRCRGSPSSGPPPAPACCPRPLRDRFGFTGHLDFYDAAELERVLHRSAGLLGVELSADGAREIAGRSRGTPRIANRLLRRVRDWAQVRGSGRQGRPRRRARRAGAVYAVDDLGLDRLDRGVLRRALPSGSGAVRSGCRTLAVAVGEEPETVETVAEPFLRARGAARAHPAWAGRDVVRAGRISGSPRLRAPTAVHPREPSSTSTSDTPRATPGAARVFGR